MAWHRRPKVPPELDPEGFSMTPMIDVTFQLMLFFMITSDMSSHQVETLTLPSARMAVITEGPETLVNVTADGRVRIGGRTFPDEALENFFATQAQSRRALEAPVLIRADRSTAFEHVQKILTIAAERGQKTRVSLGARLERSQP